MFNPFKKKLEGKIVQFKIKGMHCTSCGMNIDGELEDTDGVISATTSYAKARSTVEFDPAKITEKQIQQIIEKLGYRVEKINLRIE